MAQSTIENLEDFYEELKYLPAAIKIRLIEILNLDEKVLDGTKNMEDEVKKFFQGAPKLNAKTRRARFKKIQAAYEQLLQLSDEKVDYAKTLTKIVIHCIMILDKEIEKVGRRLDASRPGSTQRIAQKVVLNECQDDKDSNSDSESCTSSCGTNPRSRGSNTTMGTGDGTSEPLRSTDTLKSIQIIITGKKKDGDSHGPPEEEVDVEHVDDQCFCICNRVSFGDMVACDNPKCPKEWFHYDCVGIKKPPSGLWYCPICTGKISSISSSDDIKMPSLQSIQFPINSLPKRKQLNEKMVTPFSSCDHEYGSLEVSPPVLMPTCYPDRK